MKIEYKVRFGAEPSKNKIPLSIVRKLVGEDTFIVEYCNKSTSWTPEPNLISCWIGAADGGWHSAPDGEDMPIEFIEKWINKWENNW